MASLSGEYSGLVVESCFVSRTNIEGPVPVWLLMAQWRPQARLYP